MLLPGVVITPDGRGLLFGPKNHSTIGEGTLSGGGLVVIIAEHTREPVPPAVLREPEGAMVILSMSTVYDDWYNRPILFFNITHQYSHRGSG